MPRYRCNATPGCRGVVTVQATSTKVWMRVMQGVGAGNSYFNKTAQYYKTCPVCGKVNTVKPAEQKEL